MKTDGAPLVTSPYVAQTPVYPGLETRSFDDVDILDFTAEIDLGWALLTSVTSGLDREARSITGSPPGTLAGLDSFLAFQLNTQITLGNWPPVGPTGSVAYDQNNIVAGGFDHHTITDRFIQEVRLVSPADQRLRWTAGLFYKKSDDQIVLAIPVIANPARSYLQEPFDLIFDSPTNKYRNELKELAAYGEVSYDLTDTVEVTLGARLSSPEQTITPFGGDSVFVDTPTDNLDLGYDETWFAPKLVLAWRPNDGLLTYASYAKGFRPGNANTLFLFSIPNAERARAAALLNNDAATAALADRDLAYYRDNFSYEGDELNSFEAGLKWSSAGRRLQVTAAAYRMEWEDMIMPAETPFVPVTSTTGNPSVFHANVGKAESQGIEFELTALATDRLMLRLAGDLLDTEFKHAPVAGESFAFAPEYSLSVMADYNLPLTTNWSANLHINGSWIDEQKWSNSYGTSLNVSGSMLPSRHTVNARVTLRDTAEHWRIVLFARNLTNEQDLVARVQNGGGDPLVFTLPRSIGVEIGWRL
ncbi:MAG: TonB-dependent receptor [Pseudomonadota bacterium]